jgi:protein-S-isoprenylcysteine O-methyltransferase Ste14
MYSALLLAGVGAARIAGDATAWLVLAALFVVLVVKSRVEERGMLERHAGYREYRARTQRFVPWLY